MPDNNSRNNLIQEIQKLKEEKNAVIIAHNYQRPEIQDIADFVGDSIGLSREAQKTDAEVILFCGVDFMAETANIINPEKTVLIPDTAALCPMAMRLQTNILEYAKKLHPDAEVVLYINTRADAKALADCICTSSNAPQIVNSMNSNKILFGPDVNLASFVKKRSNKEIIPVPEYGLCPIHHQISTSDVKAAKRKHPDAFVVVHPECTAGVQDMADYIGSTEQMINYCKNSDEKEFIMGTENGMLHRLRKDMPDKLFYCASETAICPDMKMHTLEKVRDALKYNQYEVRVPEDIANKARGAIERMLSLSK